MGRIKSLPRKYKNRTIKKELIKKTSKVPKGYLRVGLSKEGKTKYFWIHRLVAETFISNPQNKPCVNHKDCNTSNNNVDNLEWCTYKENNFYGNRRLKINISVILYCLKEKYPNKKDLIKKVEEIRKEIEKL